MSDAYLLTAISKTNWATQ